MATEHVDGGAVREIERIAREAAAIDGKTTIIDGVIRSAVPLHDTRLKQPDPAPLALGTLQSLADYAKSEIDFTFREARTEFVHIEGPRAVSFGTGCFGPFAQRATLAKAVASECGFNFGRYLPHEQFLIGLMSQFEETPDRGRLAALLGSIKWEAGVTTADDGVSQQVTARKGIVLAATVTAPQFFKLRPFRTFGEIEQPESVFLLRVQAGADKPACAMLEETDGGRWELEAVSKIKTWLKTEIDAAIPILG